MSRLARSLAFVVLATAACRPYGPAIPGSGRAPAPVAVEPPAASDTRPLDAPLEELRGRGLIIPVAGVPAGRIHDSFSEGRSDERRHNAIDIMAPRGTPVLAADSGRILRMSSNRLGGITIYATDPAERFVYYYAHLDRYRKGIAPGDAIARGDTLGYVGTTGNAPADVPHLHFQVMRMPENRINYWNGEPINPFPILAQSGTRRDDGVRQAGAVAGSAGESAGAKSPPER
ncbi:MAG TPA: M23 family metallopeptidase [Gemmatimonadaceae bacterium]